MIYDIYDAAHSRSFSFLVPDSFVLTSTGTIAEGGWITMMTSKYYVKVRKYSTGEWYKYKYLHKYFVVLLVLVLVLILLLVEHCIIVLILLSALDEIFHPNENVMLVLPLY